MANGVKDVLESPAGSKQARVAAALAGAGGGATLTWLVLSRLTPDQLYSLISDLGGYFLLAVTGLVVFSKVGNRAVSAIFRLATEVRAVGTGMQAMADSVQEIARKDDERAIAQELTLNMLAANSEKLMVKSTDMRYRQDQTEAKVSQVLGILERIANQEGQRRAQP